MYGVQSTYRGNYHAYRIFWKTIASCPVSVSSYWPNLSDRQYFVPTISPN